MTEDKVVLHFEVRDDGTLKVFNQAGRELGQLERKATSASESISSSLKGIGTASAFVQGALGALAGLSLAKVVEEVVDLGKAAIDRADDFNTLSERTGVAVETLTGLKGVAIENDVSLDTLARGMQRLSMQMGKGNDAFNELGVKIRDAEGQYRDVADVFQDTVAQLSLLPMAERNAQAAEIFGRSYMEMTGVLRLHASELQAQMDRGREAIQVTTEQAKTADDLKENLSYLGESVVSLAGTFLNPLIPSITGGTRALQEFIATAARAMRDVANMGPIDAVSDWVNRGLAGGAEWRKQEARKFGAYGMTSETGASVMTDVSPVNPAEIFNAEYSHRPSGTFTGPPTSAMPPPKEVHARGGGSRGGGGGGGSWRDADREAARELARLAREEEESIRRSTEAYQAAREIRRQTATEVARAAMDSARTDEQKIRAFAEQQRIERETLQYELHRLDLQLRFADASGLTTGEQEKLRAQIEAARAHLAAMPGEARRFTEELENARRTVYDIGSELEDGVRRVVDGIFAGGGEFKLNDILKGTGQAMASGFISALIAAEMRKNEFDVMVNENMTVKMPGIFKAGSVMIEDTWGGLMTSLTSATSSTTIGIGQMFSSLFGSAAGGASSLGGVFKGALGGIRSGISGVSGGIKSLFGGGQAAAPTVAGMTSAEGATVAVAGAGSGAAPAAAGGLGAAVPIIAGVLIAGDALWSGANAAGRERDRQLTIDDFRERDYVTKRDAYRAFSEASIAAIPLIGPLLKKLGVGLGDVANIATSGIPFAIDKIFGVDIVEKLLKSIIKVPTAGDQRSNFYRDFLAAANVNLGIDQLNDVQWYRAPKPEWFDLTPAERETALDSGQNSGYLGFDTRIMRGNPQLESLRPYAQDLGNLLFGSAGPEGEGFGNVLVNKARYLNQSIADVFRDIDKVVQKYGLTWASMFELANQDSDPTRLQTNIETIVRTLGRDLPTGVDAYKLAIESIDYSAVEASAEEYKRQVDALSRKLNDGIALTAEEWRFINDGFSASGIAAGQAAVDIDKFEKRLKSLSAIWGSLEESINGATQAAAASILAGQGIPQTSTAANLQSTLASLAAEEFSRTDIAKQIKTAQAAVIAPDLSRDEYNRRVTELMDLERARENWLLQFTQSRRYGVDLYASRTYVPSAMEQAAEQAQEAQAPVNRAETGRTLAATATGLRGDAARMMFGLLSKSRQRAALYSQLDVVDTKIRGLEVGGITPEEVPQLQALLAQRGDIGRGIAGYGGRRNVTAGAGILESTASIAERWARVLDPQVTATKELTESMRDNIAAVDNLVTALVGHAKVIMRENRAGQNHPAARIVHSNPRDRAEMRRVMMAR